MSSSPRAAPPYVGSLPPFAWAWVAPIAAAKLILHLAVVAVTPYGLHRDELLYLAMGRHQAFWVADFPPFIGVAAEAMRFVGGDTLLAVRLLPALTSAALVVLAAVLARAMGGGWRAQGLAALAVLASPLFLRSGGLFQPVVFDQLWWTLGLLALVQVVRSDGRRGWGVLAAAAGLGLLTKHSILFFGLAAAAGLLAAPERHLYRTLRPWLAAALAVAIGSATLVGQVRLGWPVVEQMAALRAAQLDRVSPLAFSAEQLLWGPGTVLAYAGLAALLVARTLRPYRVVGFAALAALALLVALQGKSYYAGPLFPALFAAGAVWLDALPAPRLRRRDAVLLAGNYGQAGALDFYGPRLGLPYVVSPHTSFWYYGPGPKPGRVLVAIGADRASLEAAYREVREAVRHTHPWAVAEERDLPVFVATGPRASLQAVWPTLAGIY